MLRIVLMLFFVALPAFIPAGGLPLAGSGSFVLFKGDKASCAGCSASEYSAVKADSVPNETLLPGSGCCAAGMLYDYSQAVCGKGIPPDTFSFTRFKGFSSALRI